VADYDLKFSDQLDLNVYIDNGAADAGVLYSIPGHMSQLAAVDAAGVVTPLKPGLVMVEARENADGDPIAKFLILIKEDRQYQLDQDMKSGAKKTQIALAQLRGANDQTPPVLGALVAVWGDDVLNITFDPALDPDSDIVSMRVDIRSQDGQVVVADNQSVGVEADSAAFPLVKDGRTYEIKLIAKNAAMLTTETVITYEVPGGYGTAGYGESGYGL